MEWVYSFYEEQAKLFVKEAVSTSSPYHLEQLRKIEGMVNDNFTSILELGPGLGEFAITAANDGYDVTAIELIEFSAKQIEERAKSQDITGSLTVICDDFYHASVNQTFDVVCYLDGFGIGSDTDQQKLLRRIHDWLTPDGCAIIDIYTPWFWANTKGQQMDFATFKRQYDFDADGCRMIDTWYNNSTDSDSFSQSLRCYSPEDLRFLLNGTGLELVDVVPGGYMDYATGEYHQNAPLDKAMFYTVKLVKK